jgi:ABC-type branched-subunit amino acid transport system substrate-binding protein
MKNTATFRRNGWRRRLASAVGMTAIASVFVTGCAANSSEAGAAGEGDVVLYASLGLSGSSANLSPALQEGMNAAVSAINDNGGLLGREMKLDVENNESDPTKAVSNLQQRLNSDEPEVVWAGTTSSETLAMLSLTTREEVIALNNGSAPEIGDATTFPYSFSAGADNEATANFLAKEMQDQGFKRIGVLTPSGAFGEGVSRQYVETLEAAGLTVIPQTYDSNAVEMDGPLARINDQSPDAVIFNDFTHPGYVLKSRLRAGMGDVPFYGDISTTNVDMSTTVTEAETEGVRLMTYTIQTSAADRPGANKLLDSLQNVEDKSGLYLYALSYDTVLAYANAVEAAGTTDAEAVRAAMEAGEGDTYPLAMVDDIGWTEEWHIGAGKDDDLFTLIPVTPLVDGQFQLGN